MENFFTSIQPFYRLAKFFGLFSMSYRGSVRKGILKFTICSIIRTLLAFFALFAMIFFILVNHIMLLVEQRPFLINMVWSWFLVLIYPVIFIQLILQVSKMKKLRSFLLFMNETDKKLQQLQINIDHKKQRRFISYNLTFFVGIMLIRCILQGYTMVKNRSIYRTRASVVVQEICYLCYLFYCCLLSFQFIFITYLLRERFRAIKDLLRWEFWMSLTPFWSFINILISFKPLILNTMFSNFFVQSSHKNFNDKFVNVKLFGEVFHDLCDAVKHINNLLAYHLITILLAMLVLDVFGLYNIFKILKLAGNISVSYNILFFIIFHFILRTFIAHIGSSTSNEPQDLIEMIAKLINKQLPNDLMRMCLFNYLKQFQTRNFKFQTLFLTINWNIVLGVSMDALVDWLIIH